MVNIIAAQESKDIFARTIMQILLKSDKSYKVCIRILEETTELLGFVAPKETPRVQAPLTAEDVQQWCNKDAATCASLLNYLRSGRFTFGAAKWILSYTRSVYIDTMLL